MKKLWMVIPALLVIAGMVLTGCSNGSTTPSTDTSAITWTVKQRGGAGVVGQRATATTTHIEIEFSRAVTEFSPNRVSIAPEERAEFKAGTLKKGTGTTWEFEIEVLGQGDVDVTITTGPGLTTGVVAGTKSTMVYLKDEIVELSWTATANGTLNSVTTDEITINFTNGTPATDLELDDITIGAGTTNPGAANATALTGSGAGPYKLAITTTTAGNITIAIDKTGVDDAAKTVLIHKEAFNPDLYDFTSLTVAWESGFTDKKGWVEGEDFRDVKYSKPDSFIRITFKLDAGADGSWGQGDFGRVGLTEGGLIVRIPTNTPTAAEVYVDIPVADILANIGSDATRFYVNIYNAEIVSVELVETKSGVRPQKPTQSTVSFDLDGGTYLDESEIEDVLVEYGEPLGNNFPIYYPQKAGNVFKGWFDDEDNEYTATEPNITEDVELKAGWEAGTPATYTVSFNLNGGTSGAITDVVVEEGQPLGDDFPANPRKDDDNWFDGWQDSDDNVFTAATPIFDDVALTAQWVPNTQPAITRQPDMTGFTLVQRIYADGGNAVNHAQGKGNIEGADLQALKDATSGSVLVLYVYNTASANRNTWGIGTFKGLVETDQFKTSDLPGTSTGFVIVNVEELLDEVGAASEYIFVNIYNQCIVQKIELWEVDQGYVPPARTTTSLGAFTWSGENGWVTNGTDDVVTTLDVDTLKNADYLVIEIEAIDDAQWGFGGWQLVINHNGDGWAWNQITIAGDWTNFAGITTGTTYYLVVDLSQISAFGTIDSQAKFKVNSFPSALFELVNGYLVTGTVVKPNGAADLGEGDDDIVYGFITGDASVIVD